jgi:hypothetical protein
VTADSDIEGRLYTEYQKRGPDFQANFGKECLLWGLGCGDLRYATRALAMSRRFLVPADEAAIGKLLETIHVVAAIAKEKVSGALMDYLSNCWETVSRSCNAAKKTYSLFVSSSSPPTIPG